MHPNCALDLFEWRVNKINRVRLLRQFDKGIHRFNSWNVFVQFKQWLSISTVNSIKIMYFSENLLIVHKNEPSVFLLIKDKLIKVHPFKKIIIQNIITYYFFMIFCKLSSTCARGFLLNLIVLTWIVCLVQIHVYCIGIVYMSYFPLYSFVLCSFVFIRTLFYILHIIHSIHLPINHTWNLYLEKELVGLFYCFLYKVN